ncbi:hypothetical protein NBRC116598_42010 [Pseudophaeobacter arcticus]|uniref:CorA-like Mg2+ transporter protein n=1 Tax=Pseudophaeobacter arcticus TaxID=385492 RepID=A0ABQ0ASJ7_9RHOB
MNEISPDGTAIYSINIEGHVAWAIFCETALCIAIDNERSYEALTEDLVSSELQDRAEHHASLIEDKGEVVVHTVMTEICQALSMSQIIPKVSYVFGSYCLSGENKISDKEKSLLKILAEPSIIDVDDMLASSEYTTADIHFPDPDHRLFQRTSDIDPSALTTTYVTWASVVSYSMDQSVSNRTKDLIICLEARLQATWNRCYAFSEYADQVFERKQKVKDFDQLYWQFVRVLDDAKSTISSTFSTRAGEFFAEMVRTSHLEGEIARLEMKLGLVEKFVEQDKERRNAVYQKTIEGLLFIAAVGSLIQVLLPVPLIQNERIAWSIITGLSLLGVLAILRVK